MDIGIDARVLKKSIIVGLTAFLLSDGASSFISCKNNPLDSTLGTPRSFSWTIDTLSAGDPASTQTLLKCIWGSSDQDVYVAGHSDVAVGNMFHFNGSSWAHVRLLQWDGGPFKSVGNFEDVFGFGQNDVYAVGNKYDENNNKVSFIIHFDGSRWKEIPLEDSSWMTACWGFAPNDVWFGSRLGNVYRYNGTGFSIDGLGRILEFLAGNPNGVLSVTGTSSRQQYLLLSAPKQYEARYFIIRRDAEGWVLDDSTNEYTSSIWLSPSGVLYRGGSGVYEKDASSWRSVLPTMNGECVAGTASNNILAVGSAMSDIRRGAVYHFDGSSWKEISELGLPNVLFTDVCFFEHSVFIVGYLYGSQAKTIVARGK